MAMVPTISVLEQALQPLLDQESVELVDLVIGREGAKPVLRIFVDKEGGVTLDDCAYLSDRIGGLFDSQEIIPSSYVLEVSSPGLDRVLKKEKDFARFVGRIARITLKQPVDGRRAFKGRIESAGGGRVAVSALETGAGPWDFELAEIDVARLEPEVEW